MNSVMNEPRRNTRWRDIVFSHAPTTDCDVRPLRLANGGPTGGRVCREWFAQRRWEDDGGHIAHETTRAAG
jgi:hypothetical protein